jgi:outer membrane biosynthesis protein TonB
MIVGGVVVLALLGVVAFAMTRGKKTENKPIEVSATMPKQEHVTIEPIVETPKPDKGSAATKPPDALIETHKPDVKPHDKKSARDKKVARDKKPPVVEVPKEQAKPAGVSRDTVTNEWLAARRDYAGYKSKNGTTLEKEYTDLVVYVQYNVSKEADLPETLARIQAFRRKIRE